MKIDITKIKYKKIESDGTIIGQCPVCAEQGHDLNKRNHLKVWPDGFNCIVHPGDAGHNKRIWELLDGKSDTPLHDVVPRVTVKPYRDPKKAVMCYFGRLGHLFSTLHTEKYR